MRVCVHVYVFACVRRSLVRSYFPRLFLLVDRRQENIFVSGKRAERMAVVRRLEVAFSPSSHTGKNMEAGNKNKEPYHLRRHFGLN